MIEIHGKQVYDRLEELVVPKYTALLVVDMQNDTCTEGGYATKTPGLENLPADNRKLLPNIIEFIDDCRTEGVFVVWIQNTYLTGGLTDSPAWLHMWINTGRNISEVSHVHEGTWGWQIIDELKPLKSEPVIKKYRVTAFHNTFLDQLLKTNKIESVLLIGTATHACVEKTAIDATIHDFYTVMVKDCCAPYDDKVATIPYYDVATSQEIRKVWAALKSGNA